MEETRGSEPFEPYKRRESKRETFKYKDCPSCAEKDAVIRAMAEADELCHSSKANPCRHKERSKSICTQCIIDHFTEQAREAANE